MSEQETRPPNPPTPPMSTPPPIPVEAYYDSTHKSFMVTDVDGNWMAVDQGGLKLRLALKQLRTKPTKHEVISPADAMVVRVQHEKHVQYAGGLAGFKRGVHVVNGAKVLVTNSPTILESKQGDWTNIRKLVEQQLSPRTPLDYDQWTYYNGWVKLCDQQLRACLASGHVTWGQVLILAGPKGCGKSLLQQLITVILGGRTASPFQYMMGETKFNHELFQSEHLCIMDEQPSKDIRSRVRFGAAIKQIAANPSHAYHGKNRDGRTLVPFWRLTISVNDEHDHLEVLPPLEDIADKAIVLYCRKEPMPMPAGTEPEKEVFWAKLMGELPAYLHWLRNEFELPAAFVGDRYGLKPFCHPHVTTMLDDLLPETRLLSLVDHILFQDSLPEWVGTAEDLSRHLMDDDAFGVQARQLVMNSTTCGRLLGRLANTHPSRVVCQRSSSHRNWLITRNPEPRPPSTPHPDAVPKDFLDDVTV